MLESADIEALSCKKSFFCFGFVGVRRHEWGLVTSSTLLKCPHCHWPLEVEYLYKTYQDGPLSSETWLDFSFPKPSSKAD